MATMDRIIELYFSFAFSYPAKEKVGWYAYFPATSKKQIKLKTNA